MYKRAKHLYKRPLSHFTYIPSKLEDWQTWYPQKEWRDRVEGDWEVMSKKGGFGEEGGASLSIKMGSLLTSLGPYW